ncbi:ribonuclease P [Candidatus Woesearchaeota archaeon]|nr:ribonuclease P [Candidatus Woesearchaeota archaeon]
MVKKRSVDKVLVRKDIARLFELAGVEKDIAIADSHVNLARKTAMKFQIPLTASQRRLYCHSCYRILRPGVTCRVRLYKGKQVFYCFACKTYTRFPYSKK